MKIMKKVSIFMITVCMMLLYTSIISFAAEGTLQFSDPSGQTGEEITVTAKMSAGGAAIGDGSVTVSYDPSKLEFVSGTNATGGNGTVTMSASGTGTETELDFTMVFKALAEGTTTIDVTQTTAYLYSDETLNLQSGGSTVTIGAGGADTNTNTEAPAAGGNVEMQGSSYSFYENFSDALIPEGFSKTTMTVDGAQRSCIVQDSSGKHIFFLVTGQNDPVMALYNESDGSFTPAEQVYVGEDFYLLILAKGDGSSLPSKFQETTLDLNGTTFPAWQNTSVPDYYLVYALSSSGYEGFYQYDKVDGTYQRYVVSKSSSNSSASNSEPDTWYDKVLDLVKDNLIIVMVAVWAVILLLLIIIIVISIKLRRRNDELEEIYDNQYDEYEDGPAVRKKSRDQFIGYEDDDDYDDDDYEDDDYEDDDDDYDDDEYDDDDYEDDDYDDEDEYEDDDDDEYEEPSSKKQKDDYSIDFIDL